MSILNKISKNSFEKFDWKHLSPSPVIGVDEVGRGCLAGRVYAAAVILESSEGEDLYTDSKQLSASRRDFLFNHIISHHRYGIGFATVEEVDQLNILKAALLAMKRAVLELNVRHGHIVVDGTFKVPGLTDYSQTTLIKGDLRCTPVAAASIIAKVTRDRYMEALATEHPQYDFEKHKGYSTEAHKQKIAQYGPTAHHRKTFRGVREFLPENLLQPPSPGVDIRT